tara:strand:- start:1302 stop:2012 length:711 start_codon:yes stop_codon:yes gene_type:complete
MSSSLHNTSAEKAKSIISIASMLKVFAILSQIIHLYKKKKVDQISWFYIISLSIAIMLVLYYRYVNKLYVNLYFTIITVILSIILIGMRIYYSSNSKEKYQNQHVENLKNLYVKIAPSKIEGVGLFAIKDIPKNTNFIDSNLAHGVYMSEKELLENDIPQDVIDSLKDYWCLNNNNDVYVPLNPNKISFSYFLNHSENPSVKKINGKWMSLRDIKKGEELLENYQDLCPNRHKLFS